MFAPAYTRQFERDLKRFRRGGHDLSELKAVMGSLLAGEPLAPKFKDHKLIGAWQGRRECHLHPDWLLIYKIDQGQNLIIFERTGSHADLFG
ncbi:MAG: type II toxin-antitoxin system YafQ family toxin [Desulfobaccales bacterium]